MSHIRDAFLLLWKDRSCRRFVWQPLLIAFGLWLSVLLLGNVVLVPILEARAAALGVQPQFVGIAGRVAFTVLWFFVSGPVFYSLALAASGFFWDGLSRYAEGKRYGTVALDRRGFAVTNIVMAVRLGFALFLGVVAAVFGIFGCAPISAAIAGFAAVVETFDAPLSRRGLLFPKTVGKAFSTKGAWPIFMFASVASVFPVVNVFALPLLIVASTYAVNAAERGMPGAES